jgi:hypothetical protein
MHACIHKSIITQMLPHVKPRSTHQLQLVRTMPSFLSLTPPILQHILHIASLALDCLVSSIHLTNAPPARQLQLYRFPRSAQNMPRRPACLRSTSIPAPRNKRQRRRCTQRPLARTPAQRNGPTSHVHDDHGAVSGERRDAGYKFASCVAAARPSGYNRARSIA